MKISKSLNYSSKTTFYTTFLDVLFRFEYPKIKIQIFVLSRKRGSLYKDSKITYNTEKQIKCGYCFFKAKMQINSWYNLFQDTIKISHSISSKKNVHIGTAASETTPLTLLYLIVIYISNTLHREIFFL